MPVSSYVVIAKVHPHPKCTLLHCLWQLVVYRTHSHNIISRPNVHAGVIGNARYCIIGMHNTCTCIQDMVINVFFANFHLLAFVLCKTFALYCSTGCWPSPHLVKYAAVHAMEQSQPIHTQLMLSIQLMWPLCFYCNKIHCYFTTHPPTHHVAIITPPFVSKISSPL